jgi:metacaspase-1
MSKKALLVGINYIGTANELKGCINDVINMKDLLIKSYGYKDSDITVITDNTDMKPTRKNILMELLKLILSGSKNMVFHYSGHGSSVRDTNNDEADGLDESLVPVDFQTNGMIIDDELRGLLQCVNESCKMTVILDCCHSGTGLDLTYNVYERVGRFYMIKDNKGQETKGQVVMISGCQDPQTSADSFEERQSQGALTYCFTSVLKQDPAKKLTYEQVFKNLRTMLKDKKYSQIPNLSSGKQLQLSTVFSL